MNTGLSKREKKLIFLLLVFGAVAMTLQFAVIPMRNTLVGIEEELELLEQQKFEAQTRFGLEHVIRQSHDEARDSAKAVTERYPTNMASAEVDRLLTNLCFRHELIPASLSMSGASYLHLPERQDVFLVVTANMNLSGNFQAFKSLLDDVAASDNLRIIRTAYSFGRTGTADDTTTFSAVFEVTMLAEMELGL
jgi:hypothetical protein